MHMKRFLKAAVGTASSRPGWEKGNVHERDEAVPTSAFRNSYLSQAMELTEDELAAIQGGCLIAIGDGLAVPCGCSASSFLGFLRCF